MRRWGPIVAALLGILFLGALITTVVDDRDWDGPRRGGDEITRIVGTDGQETIIIHDNDHRGFFPLGILFIPLFILFFFGLSRAIFWRSHWRGPWGGPGGPGGPGMRFGHGGPPWFDEWHRRAHQDAPRAPGDEETPNTTPVQE